MPRSFVDVTFSAGGKHASIVVRRLQTLAHVTFISGEHDLYFDWNDPSEFELRLDEIHDSLAGTGAIYRVHTQVEVPSLISPSWPPTLVERPDEEHHGTPEANPAFPQHKV